MNETLIDNLRYVVQNMRLQPGDMAKVQADIVASAMMELVSMDAKIEELNASVLLEKSRGDRLEIRLTALLDRGSPCEAQDS